ncbi:MAG: peptidylprolyl isomerase [Terracidiphilus sp.]|jgi:peptidyl-prolyl cis-trans isomerase A (cyclophilin A)
MKLQNPLLVSVLAVAFAAAAIAQTPSQPAKAAPKAPAAPQGNPTAVIDTSMGRLTCQLFPKQAPQAVANFIGLAKGTKDWIDPRTGLNQHLKPYYNGTIFHRVIPGFMIQGGDPTGTGTGNPGYMFVDEFDPSLNFDVPGRLAMANSGPNTNGSQFFITEQPYASLNQHYTIFGQCDDTSVQVVKAITGVPRNSSDKPLTSVVLKKVTIVRPGQPMPPLPGAAAPKPAPKPAAPKP